MHLVLLFLASCPMTFLTILLHVNSCQPTQVGVTAGDLLQGKVVVVLNANRDLPAGTCTIYLRMYGKEKIEQSGKHHKKGERQFFLTNLQLEHPEWRQTAVRCGTTYVLPFAIPLPESLPATDSLSNRYGSYRIQYKIRVTHGRMFKKDIYVHVKSAPLPDMSIPCLVEPKSYNLSSMKIIPRGQLLFAASVQNTHIGKGENLTLHLACQNDSTAMLHKVKISLVEHYAWTTAAQWSSSVSLCPRMNHTIFTINDVTLPGIDRGSKSREQVRHSSNSNSQQESFRELHRQLASDQNCVLIQMPLGLRDSYHGKKVQVTHTLVIDLKTDKTVNNPSISIPLRIGNPPIRGASIAAQQTMTSVPVVPSAPPEPMVFTPSMAIPTETMNVPAMVPIVDAVAIPSDASVSAAVVNTASDSVIFLGDDAIFVQPENSDHDNNDDEHLSGRVPISGLAQSPASLDTLRQEMLASINDYDIISRHLENDSWRQVLANLSPEEFGSILACVHVDFDQPRVATLLAGCRPHLTCAHVVEAVRNTADWNRSNMVNSLLPFCVDGATNGNLVLDELSDWERTVTEAAFARARGSAPPEWDL